MGSQPLCHVYPLLNEKKFNLPHLLAGPQLSASAAEFSKFYNCL